MFPKERIIALFICLPLLLFPLVYAPETNLPPEQRWDETPTDSKTASEQIDLMLDDWPAAPQTMNAPPGTEANKNEGTLKVERETTVNSDGSVDSNLLGYEQTGSEEVRFENVVGFMSYQPALYQPIFTARKAKRLEYLGMTVINARDIVGYKDSVRIGSGDIVQTDVATLSNVTGLEETVRTISFDSVDAMYVDKIILLGLGNSSFAINQDGVLVDSRITSRLDNNTLDLKGLFVTLDAGETVRFQDNGTLHAMSEDNVTFQFYDERVIGAAELWTEGMYLKCVKLAQFASSSNF